MALGNISDPNSVLKALAEYDAIGQSQFLAKYSFGKSRGWTLLHKGVSYDAKAILGAAHGYEFPSEGPLTPYDFYGGAPTAKKLRALGFQVEEPEPRNPPWKRDELILALHLYMQRRPTFPGPSDQQVIELSKLLNRIGALSGQRGSRTFRNASGVAMKLQNFRRFDPQEKGKGLKAGGRAEESVWAEFASKPDELSARAAEIKLGVEGLERELGTVAPDEDIEGEEGGVVLRLHKQRERRPKLIRQKKAEALAKHGALVCEVCRFDFAKRYGPRGEGFIECHHTKPVAMMRPGDTTKLKDLALLCANCHRMAHRQPWVSIAELAKLYEELWRDRSNPRDELPSQSDSR